MTTHTDVVDAPAFADLGDGAFRIQVWLVVHKANGWTVDRVLCRQPNGEVIQHTCRPVPEFLPEITDPDQMWDYVDYGGGNCYSWVAIGIEVGRLEDVPVIVDYFDAELVVNSPCSR